MSLPPSKRQCCTDVSTLLAAHAESLSQSLNQVDRDIAHLQGTLHSKKHHIRLAEDEASELRDELAFWQDFDDDMWSKAIQQGKEVIAMIEALVEENAMVFATLGDIEEGNVSTAAEDLTRAIEKQNEARGSTIRKKQDRIATIPTDISAAEAKVEELGGDIRTEEDELQVLQESRVQLVKALEAIGAGGEH
jgi:DNA repair exonuclease SbcCD ATPase subunit